MYLVNPSVNSKFHRNIDSKISDREKLEYKSPYENYK